MQVFLETERLVLRRFTPDDVDNLVELDGDPQVMHFITGGRTTPREEIENDLLPWFLHYYEGGDRYGFWAAIEKSTGTFLGWFHCRPADGQPSDEPELGYRLRRSAWGKGYATEAAAAMLRYGFETLRLHRVIATCQPENPASWRVMHKLGMRREAHFRKGHVIRGEEWLDEYFYAMLEDDWFGTESEKENEENP
jgi:RimJ/RimL family protein N-acetyltransferase